MPAWGGAGSPGGANAPVMAQRKCATATSAESLRTSTSVIVSRLSLNTNLNASVSLWRISSLPFHHQPITLTTSPSGVKRSAYAAASCAFQAEACFASIASIAAWSLLIPAAAVEIAASNSGCQLPERVGMKAPSYTRGDDGTTD